MGRIERVNSELLKQISYVIDYELKDPRISVGMISITRVKTTPDLKYAKVYLSFYTDDKDKQKEAPRRNQKNYENTKRIFTFEVIKKEAVILPSY